MRILQGIILISVICLLLGREAWSAEDDDDDAFLVCGNERLVKDEVLCNGVSECINGEDESPALCGCPEGEFLCNDTLCVDITRRCDTVVDCVNGTDEMDCETFSCPVPLTKCANHKCISADKVCDFVDDCGDNSDELSSCNHRACYGTEFTCNNSECVSLAYLCDGVPTCKDGSDEMNCDNPDFFFHCDEDLYIPIHMRCDGWADCFETHSDEINCGPCNEDTHYQCNNTQCVALAAKCDGRCDCVSTCDDEYNCEHVNCTEGKKMCSGTSQCVDEFRFCDNIWDCMDGSDESNCSDPTTCKADEFRCASGQCIPRDKECVKSTDANGVTQGCLDQSHLWSCRYKECGPGYFKCSNSYCIPETDKCNNKIDCSYSYEDELVCLRSCPDYLETCQCHNNTMDCTDTGLTDLQVVHEMDHLNLLTLDHNHLDGVIEESVFANQTFISILSIRNSSIQQLPENAFRRLIRLRSLNLESNNLTELRKSTFYGLRALRTLYLAGNNIEYLEPHAFKGLSQLTVLDLRGHKIRRLWKNTFSGLGNLMKLDLSNNAIEFIDEGAFNGLISLRELVLTGNKISALGKNVFHGLPNLANLDTDEFRFCCQARTVATCLPLPNEFSSCEDLMSNTVLRVFIWILGLIALFGNAVVIIWRLKDTRDSRVHSFLITNLAIGDFLLGVYMIIIASVDMHYRGIYSLYDLYWRTSALCKTAGFISMFSSELSVFTLVAITLDRFIAIIFPFKLSRLGMKGARILMCVLWVVVFFLAVLPLVGFTYFENFYGRSGVCLAFHMTEDRPNGWQYSVFVFLALNLLSFVAILVSYLWMFIVARKTRAAARAPQSRGDRAMARRMTLIVMTDACCWVPIILISAASLSGSRFPPQVYAWIAVFVLPLNSAANPILYTISTVNFLSHARSKAFMFRKSFINSFGVTDSKATVMTAADRVSPPSPRNKMNENFNFDSPHNRDLECMALNTIAPAEMAQDSGRKKSRIHVSEKRVPITAIRGRRARPGDSCSSANYTRTEVLYGDDSDHY